MTTSSSIRAALSCLRTVAAILVVLCCLSQLAAARDVCLWEDRRDSHYSHHSHYSCWKSSGAMEQSSAGSSGQCIKPEGGQVSDESDDGGPCTDDVLVSTPGRPGRCDSGPRPAIKPVPVVSGQRYVFTCRVKLVSDVPGSLWHSLMVKAVIKLTTGGTKQDVIGKTPHVRAEDGWVEVGGDFIAPPDSDTVRVMVSVDDSSVEFLIDEPHMEHIAEDSHWREAANARIAQLRKGPLTVRITVSDKYDPDKVEVKIDLKRHAFPFGGAVSAQRISSPSSPENVKYRDFFQDNFWFATIANACKWRFTEKRKGREDFSSVIPALDALDQMGVPVRGHCVCWGKEKKIMDWLRDQSPEEIRCSLEQRIAALSDRLKNRFVHWDVDNEDLHGDWYEQHTHQAHIVDFMFRTLHARQPAVTLCTNEYQVAAAGTFTMAYRRQVAGLKERGVPVSGMGVQSHLRASPDPHLLLHRLGRLASAGVPIWITELDLHEEDVGRRAEGYEDALRIYFSHPAVHGIIMWAWDGSGKDPNRAIVEVPSFNLNEAGERVVGLWREEWTTHDVIRPAGRSVGRVLEAFYGLYDVTLLYDGVEQWAHEVRVERGKETVLEILL